MVLHTRDSLKRFLEVGGFCDIIIKGIQRYPISNHLNWFINNRPSGHKSFYSFFDTPILSQEYEKVLASIDATDTLIAIAKKKI